MKHHGATPSRWHLIQDAKIKMIVFALKTDKSEWRGKLESKEWMNQWLADATGMPRSWNRNKFVEVAMEMCKQIKQDDDSEDEDEEMEATNLDSRFGPPMAI